MTEADLADISALEIPSAAQGWIEWSRQNYAEHGFGLWVVETHAGGFVGDCGLTMQEVEGTWQVEAGWHVRSDLRRQGYAAEAAAAVRAVAQASGVEHLIAIIRPHNVASQRVATKIGLVLERTVHKNGGAALVFGADLQASQAGGSTVRAGWSNVKDGPADLGAPGGGVGGVAWADEVGLADGSGHGEGVGHYPGAEQAVGDVDVVVLADVCRER